MDPELNVNIVDLGLVYTVQSREDEVDVEMTLTTPACPAGPEILRNAVSALEKLEGVAKANVKLVMSPALVARPDDRRRPRRARDLLSGPSADGRRDDVRSLGRPKRRLVSEFSSRTSPSAGSIDDTFVELTSEGSVAVVRS